MILSNQAIEIAQAAIKSHQCFDKPGDIVVDPKGNEYVVTFVFVIPGEGGKKWEDYVVAVSIDAQSGKVLKVEDKGKAVSLQRNLEDVKWENFISAKRAHDIALNAIKGFEHYDKAGKLTIELKKTIYYVTFPLIKYPDFGTRRADYAFQIWIEAQSGKVLKIRGAS